MFREGNAWRSICVGEGDFFFLGGIRSSRGKFLSLERVWLYVNEIAIAEGTCDDRSVRALCLRRGISAVITSYTYVNKLKCSRENECRCDKSVAGREGGELKGER